jgi:6-phosphogluconolactonase (cycloisomerase 2 family)
MNAAAAKLRAEQQHAAGTGPFKLAMDPQSNFVYVAFSGSNTVSSYRINRNSGALKLNGSATTGNGTGAIKTDPSGKFIAVDAVHNVLYQPTFPAPLGSRAGAREVRLQ